MKMLDKSSRRGVHGETLSGDTDWRTARTTRGLRFEDAAIRAQKRAEFKAIKARTWGATRAPGSTLIRDYKELPSAFVRVPSIGAFNALLARPEVAGVYENVAVPPLLINSLTLNGQPPAFAGFGGAGTTVAVIDTGIDYMLPDFGSCTAVGQPASCRVVASFDVVEDDGELDQSSGLSKNHGTKMSRIIANTATETDLYVIDAAREDGLFPPNRIMAALDDIGANGAAFGIVAVNMSFRLGAPSSTACLLNRPSFDSSLAQPRALGIQPIAASGNDGLIDRLTETACSPETVSVGAVYSQDRVQTPPPLGLARYLTESWVIGHRQKRSFDRLSSSFAVALFYKGTGAVAVAVGLALVFMSFGSLLVLHSALATELFPTAYRSTAAGVRETVATVGASLGLGLLTLLYAATGSHPASITWLLLLTHGPYASKSP